MPTVIGTDADNEFPGFMSPGEPYIYYGRGGNDTISDTGTGTSIGIYYGEGGNDLIRLNRNSEGYGGDGSDAILLNDPMIDGSWTQLADGGDGNDFLIYQYGSRVNVTMLGGEGNDLIIVAGRGNATVDAGAGNDVVQIGFNLSGTAPQSAYSLTLGAGNDIVVLRETFDPNAVARPVHRIMDFTAGEDRLFIDFGRYFYQFSPGDLQDPFAGQNPFTTGKVRLATVGSDTVVQIDRNDGKGWTDILILVGVNAATVTDVGGYRVDGSGTVNHVVALPDLASFGNGSADSLLIQSLLVGGAGADTLTGNDRNNSLNGGPGADTIYAYGGDDDILGGTGNDLIYAGSGNDLINFVGDADTVYGEDGNDNIGVLLNGSTGRVHVDGGAGNDRISVVNGGGLLANQSVTIIGGEGNDTIQLDGFATGNIVDAGAGDDRVIIGSTRGAVVTLGLGADTLVGAMNIRPDGAGASFTPPDIVITDFQAGIDRLDFDYYDMTRRLWNQTDNLFTFGWVQLVQDGADTLLRIDFDGAAGTTFGFLTIMRFQNVNASSFTPADFKGFAPVVSDGSINVVGSAGNDNAAGDFGNDSFDLSQGGDDTANGGSGNDAFFFGGAFTAADTVDGGDGTNDQIGLQGNYSGGLTLGAHTIAGIELIGLLGGAGNGYAITTVDANVAAGQVLTLFGTNLAPGNNFTFNGSAETDGSFRIYGGAGTDNLTGGAQNDGFWFGPGRFDPSVDRVNGGGGANDQLALDGDYTITLDGTAVSGIETITLMTGPAGDRNSFDITLTNGQVGAGQQLTLWGLQVVNAIRIDASAELDGSIRVFGGQGADSIYGSAGDDRLFGGAGGDFLYGGAGNDTYVYDAVSQSTGVGADGIHLTAGDKIDFNFTVGGIAATVAGGSLTGDFDNDLMTAIGAGQMGVGQAVLFRPDAGIYAGNSFLIVDANGVAGYQAGEDYVIQLIGNPTVLPPDPFV